MSVFNDLITSATKEEFVEKALSQLQALGVNVNLWKDSTSIDYGKLQKWCADLADMDAHKASLARAFFLSISTGDLLTQFAKSQYQVDRLLATPTIGTIRLVSTPTTPPYVILPGDLKLGTSITNSPNEKIYTNITGGNLLTGGTLDLTFQSVSTGSTYNIPNTSQLYLKTSLAGVLVSLPLLPNAVTWITSQGNDDESDDSLRQRCINRWGTLGKGGTDGAYRYWASYPINGGTTSPVRRVKIVSNIYANRAKPAYTTVYVAGQNGVLSNADLAAVQANFENPQKYPLKFRVSVENAIPKFIQITGTVNIYRSSNLQPADVQAAVEDALLSYQNSLDIGARGVYKDAIISYIFSRPTIGEVKINLTTIRNIELASPQNTVTINYDEYPILQYTGGNLNYVLVD